MKVEQGGGRMKGEIRTKRVGREKISNPAGTFDTEVFESSSLWTPGPKSPTIQIIYVAKGVGIVRHISKTYQDIIGHGMRSGTDPNELLQKGIEAMQRGQSPDNVLKELQSKEEQKDSAGKARPETQEVIVVRELQTYSVK